MKKSLLFTAAALCAMNLSAQEVWKAADFNLANATLEVLTNSIYGGGNNDTPDTSIPGELKTSQIMGSTTNVTLTGLSTPNGDKTLATGADAWELKGNPDNQALNVDGCDPQFTQYLIGQGNPTMNYWEFTEETDNGPALRIKGDVWTPGNNMPAKGAYWKFDVKASGTLKTAVYINKGNHPFYIVDAATKQPMAPANVDVAIFYQNTGFAFEGNADEGTAKYLNTGKMADDYILQHTNGVTQNRPVLGYVTFPVEAGKSYYVFNPQSQVGLYGFQFTPGASGVENVVIDQTINENAPIYNIYGQRVNKEYKGILIQNGKKFINK